MPEAQSRLRTLVGVTAYSSQLMNQFVWDVMNPPTMGGGFLTCWNEGGFFGNFGCFSEAVTRNPNSTGVWSRIQEVSNNPLVLTTRHSPDWLPIPRPVKWALYAAEEVYYYSTYVVFLSARFVYTGVREAEDTFLGWLHYLSASGLLGWQTVRHARPWEAYAAEMLFGPVQLHIKRFTRALQTGIPWVGRMGGEVYRRLQ